MQQQNPLYKYQQSLRFKISRYLFCACVLFPQALACDGVQSLYTGTTPEYISGISCTQLKKIDIYKVWSSSFPGIRYVHVWHFYKH